MTLVAERLWVLGRQQLRGATNLTMGTVNGLIAGRKNRLPTDFGSTSRSMNPCVSLAKPFTKPSTRQGRGAFERGLVSYLRSGRAFCVSWAKAWAHVSEDAMVYNRSDEAQDRAVPGH